MSNAYIIRSETTEGKTFRPSDWIDRMASLGANYKLNRLVFSPHMHPEVVDGKKCLFVCDKLDSESPGLYQHIIRFAQNNNLVIENRNC